MANQFRDAIIIDLDGTLADNSHRRHHVEQDNPRWDKFYQEIPDDDVNQWCKKLINRFKTGHTIYIVTGREGTEQIKTDTKVWLAENNIYYDHLHFRPKKDYRQDSEVKKEILENEIRPQDVLFAVDDRKQVVEMWRDEGITVLDCAGGEF